MVHHAPNHGVGEVARDTIAAAATPPGQGGVGILRISGPATSDIARAIVGRRPPPRLATLFDLTDRDGSRIDRGLALYFPAPHSYTGEDVLELHLHGSPVVLELALMRVTALGARLARPGEYTERAFLNGKLDLAQAEAVADLIESSSAAAARSAMRSLAGEFSSRVHALAEDIVSLRVHVEAAIDFPEEEIDHLADERIGRTLEELAARLTALLTDARQGALLQSGMSVVIAGPPNAGKSSLLNALARRDAAIVTAIAGTTRDVLRERIDVDGMPLHVIDTAGLRESADEIEREGVRRARAEMSRADRVLLVIDDEAPPAHLQALLGQLPAGSACTVVRNKIDLTGRPAGGAEEGGRATIALSAKTGEGLDALRSHLKACMGFQTAGEGTFIARARHVDALRRAQSSLHSAGARLTERAGELVAEELARAQVALGEITGQVTTDDLLGRIFSTFCIGK